MELAEQLEAKGVKTLDELEAKIKADAQAQAQQTIDGLKSQIENLETIKGSQGDQLGDLRKQLEAAEEAKKALAEKIAEKKPDSSDGGASDDEPTEEDSKAKNEKWLLNATDEQLAQLNAELKGVSPEVRKLVKSSERGKAAFIAQIFGGESTEQSGEVFRRPAMEEKLSIEEQIARGLGRAQPKLPGGARLAGSGFNADRPAQAQGAQQPVFSGGLSDRIRQSKQE